ncbi:MAG: RNA methyltransferase [Rhodospirillaceae bacterium]
MRGYFGIGVEGLSKPMNAGNLYRSAHALGASFVFTIAATYKNKLRKSDTSSIDGQVPFYEFEDLGAIQLPRKCALVGVEITEDAAELPSFSHPRCAAYILGMERSGLSSEVVEACDYLVKVPTNFSLNVATAGAIVMYDRLISLQRFGPRPMAPGAPVESLSEHVFGKPKNRSANRK